MGADIRGGLMVWILHVHDERGFHRRVQQVLRLELCAGGVGATAKTKRAVERKV